MPRSTDPLVIGGVVGDVLEPFTSCVSLRIVYNNCSEVINCCELKPSQILNKPRVEIGGDDLRNLYTLVSIYKCHNTYHSFIFSFVKFSRSLNIPSYFRVLIN